MTKGITLNKIFAYIISFLIMLDGSHMWQLTGNFMRATDVKYILTVASLLAVLATLSLRKVKISVHFLRNILIVTILFFIYWLMTRFSFIYFLRIQYILFISFTTYMYIMFKYDLILDVVNAFIRIWIFIALVTSFFWLFGSVLNLIPLSTTSYVWFGDIYKSYTFHNLYYANPIQAIRLGGETFFRNTGIYAEAPGMANNFMYTIGLELSFLKNTKNHKRRLLILIITSLTTFSTKIFVGLPVMLFLAYVFNNRDKKKAHYQVFTILKMITTIIIAFLTVYVVMAVLEDKSSTGSYRIRLDDINSMLSVFFNNPIFGIGFGNTESIITNFEVNRRHDGLSMGLFILMAQGGVWLTTMYLAPLFLTVKRFWKNSAQRHFIIFGVGVFINLIISNVMSSPEFLLILAAGYAYFNLTEFEKEHMLYAYQFNKK